MNIFTNDKSAILLQDLVYNSFFDNEQIIEDNNPTEDDIFIYIVGILCIARRTHSRYHRCRCLGLSQSRPRASRPRLS